MAHLSVGEDRGSLVIGPNAAEIARRLLINARVFADHMPVGCNSVEARHLLLTLFAADRNTGLSLSAIAETGLRSSTIVDRWATVLAAAGMITRRGDLVALTPEGRDILTRICEQIYEDQCAFL